MTQPDASPTPVIQAQGVGKRFDIYLNDRSRLSEFLGRRRHHQEHWALRDVNFTVPRGQSFGVIGSNGAGKSTLLKLIAGISEPTRGRLSVHAPISTLLDLGLGFHQNFSGRENVFLNCQLLGMSRDEIESRLADIVAFAELGEFIDYPVRTYSSGMSLRLGFAIAAHMDSEVFLVDEVLAVGDQYFQRKCVRKIQEFVEQGRTIVLVSHDLHAIRSLCDTVLWLDSGEVRALGPSREVIEQYMDVDRELVGMHRPRPMPVAVPDPEPAPESVPADGGPVASLGEGSAERPKAVPMPTGGSPGVLRYTALDPDPRLRKAVVSACALPDAAERWATPLETTAYENYDGDRAVLIGSGEARVLKVRILDGKGHVRERFRSGEPLVVAVTFQTTEPIERPILGVAIHRNDGVYVYGPNTRFDQVLDGTYEGIYTFFLHYPELPLLAGRYRVSVAIFDKGHLKPHVWHNQLYDFEVAQQVEDHGLVHIPHSWGLITHAEGEQAAVVED